MLTENGFTADLSCITACRPTTTGNDNGTNFNPLGFCVHSVEEDTGPAGIDASEIHTMIGDVGSNSGIMGTDWINQAATKSSVHGAAYPPPPGQQYGNVQCEHLNVSVWGCGPNGNGWLVQWEQAGKADFTDPEWETPEGELQLASMAEAYAEVCVYMTEHTGRKWEPHRATQAEWVACAAGDTSKGVGGCGRHQDVSVWLGGTDHTDPGDAYPIDKMIALAHARWLILTGGVTGGTGTGTTLPPVDEDNMANLYDNTADFEAAVARAAAKGVTDALAPGAPAASKSLSSRLQFWVWDYQLPNTSPDKGSRSGAGRILSNLGIASNPLAVAVNAVKKALGK